MILTKNIHITFIFFLLFGFLHSQNEFKVIGKVGDVELQLEGDYYRLIFKDLISKKFVEVDFKDKYDILENFYGYCIDFLTSEPPKKIMIELDYDTLYLTSMKSDVMQILVYVNHNPDNYWFSRPLSRDEVDKLFGKEKTN